VTNTLEKELPGGGGMLRALPTRTKMKRSPGMEVEFCVLKI
jgi:hypothetical protein